MVFVFYTVALILMFIGMGLADYFSYHAIIPFLVFASIAFLHLVVLFLSKITKTRGATTSVYVIGNNGQQTTAKLNKTMSQSAQDDLIISGMTRESFRQLAKALIEMEWISNRAISERTGMSRDESAIPKTSDVIAFLNNNNCIIRVGNGRYKLTDRGKHFLTNI